MRQKVPLRGSCGAMRGAQGWTRPRPLLGLALSWLLASVGACTADKSPTGASAGLDAGPDARVETGDGALDGGDEQRDGSLLDAPDDGSTEDGSTGDGGDGSAGDAQAGSDCQQQYDRVRQFVAAHRSCERDDDCAIIGGCSDSFGFAAVSAAAREEGQRLPISRMCVSFDGPLYTALCEHGGCVARRNGAACGGASANCPHGEELYHASCEEQRERPLGSCRERCTDASDTRCTQGFRCQAAEVLAVAGECTDAITRFLCLPAPSCEIVLSLDWSSSSGDASVGISPGSRSLRVYSGIDAPLPLSLWAENRTGATKTFSYQRPCPGGPLLEGLGDYDPWGTCMAGVCAENPPTQLTLAAGERVSLGVAQVRAGADSCNPSGLLLGDYDVRFSLADVSGATVCGPEALELIVR